MDTRITASFFCMILLILVPACAEQDTGSATPAPLLVWSVSTGSTASMSEHAAKVSCSGNGEQVVVGYGKGIIELRDVTGTLLWRWQSPHSYSTVWSVAISGDGSTVVAALYDPMQDHKGEIICFNQSGTVRWTTTMDGPFGFVAISRDGNTVAMTEGSRLSFFDAAGTRTGTTALEGMIWSMALSDDGSHAVAGVTTRDYTGNLYVISNNGTMLWSSSSAQGSNSVAISGDGRYVAGADQNQLRYFTMEGDRLWSFNSSPRFTGIAISSDGHYVAATSQYYVRYFNAAGTMLWQYEPPNLPTRAGPYFSHLTMSADGEHISASSDGNRTFFFDRQGTILWQNQSGSWVRDVCMSRNGKYLAIGTEQDFRYFDTGIEIPRVIPEPVKTANATFSDPGTAHTPKAPVSVFIAFVSVCVAMVVWQGVKK